MNKHILISIVLIIIVGTAAFFGGMKYQAMQISPSQAQFAQGGNMGTPGGGGRRFERGFGGNATVGKIVSTDSGSITIQLPDGSSKIINISGDTRIMKQDVASQSDLTTGQTVAAFGKTNSDGSITATNIQLNPMMRRSGSATPSAQ